jgi:hypothetical protein
VRDLTNRPCLLAFVLAVVARRVVELGAGTGIPGIFLASKGAHVVLTDLPGVRAMSIARPSLSLSRSLVCDADLRRAPAQVLPLMNWNIEANAHLLPSPDCCEAHPLAWYPLSAGAARSSDGLCRD